MSHSYSQQYAKILKHSIEQKIKYQKIMYIQYYTVFIQFIWRIFYRIWISIRQPYKHLPWHLKLEFEPKSIIYLVNYFIWNSVFSSTNRDNNSSLIKLVWGLNKMDPYHFLNYQALDINIIRKKYSPSLL